MPVLSPARLRRRLKPVLPVALSLLYGCSDAPSPVEPRVPARPHALVAPVITVTNTDDAGAGSLRQAIIDAPAGATIQFDAAVAGQTIVLSTGDLDVDKLLTIEGPVPAGITISGGLSVRAFTITTSGDLLLRNVSIVDGLEKFGAGLVVEGNATLDHVLVANNETYEGSGGGILVREDAELTVVNSTISGNVSPQRGGAIFSAGQVSIRNSTIAFNVSNGAGGVFSGGVGSLVVRNSILAMNVVGANPGTANCFIDTNVFLVFAGRNISNDDSCGTDPAIAVVNPGLESLAANGGPTRTHALAENSQAIDNGISCSEATDQRYIARPQGVSCDIGAFEFTDFGTYTITIGPNVTVNAKTGVATVTGTLACSRPTTLPLLDVSMSQTQKTTGRFTTIVKATGAVGGIPCQVSPSSWSVALQPGSGKFEPGSATGTATTSILLGRFLPATVTSALKVFQAK